MNHEMFYILIGAAIVLAPTIVTMIVLRLAGPRVWRWRFTSSFREVDGSRPWRAKLEVETLDKHPSAKMLRDFADLMREHAQNVDMEADQIEREAKETANG